MENWRNERRKMETSEEHRGDAILGRAKRVQGLLGARTLSSPEGIAQGRGRTEETYLDLAFPKGLQGGSLYRHRSRRVNCKQVRSELVAGKEKGGLRTCVTDDRQTAE